LLVGRRRPFGALAHGLVLVTNLPIPEWLFAWAAAVVLVVSFVALATLWPTPRLARIRERPIWRYPGWLDPLCGALGIAFFVLIVYAGIAGSQITLSNITPTWIYVSSGSGWRSQASSSATPSARSTRGARSRARSPGSRGDAGRAPTSEPLPYPAGWDAGRRSLGLLGYAWLELVYGNKRRDRTCSRSSRSATRRCSSSA
jgi:hypothetical protein